MPSVYATQSVFATVSGALTNTVPVDAYRGAGMPETIYLVERLIDTAAAELHLDRAELRRRNLIPTTAMPYTAPLGSVYDSGAFAQLSDSALDRSDWRAFQERRHESAARGLRRGIGLACYLATTGGPPVEAANIRFVDGGVVLKVGTQSSGQGHETAFAHLLAERLGIAVNSIVVRQGDTALLPSGGGTGGSRSLYAQGTAIIEACSRIIESGRSLAAEVLQASVDEVEFRDGRFGLSGTGRDISLLALASLQEDNNSPSTQLEATVTAKTNSPTFPNGSHVAEVEVDPATGAVKLLRYVAADDIGRVIDERLARHSQGPCPRQGRVHHHPPPAPQGRRPLHGDRQPGTRRLRQRLPGRRPLPPLGRLNPTRRAPEPRGVRPLTLAPPLQRVHQVPANAAVKNTPRRTATAFTHPPSRYRNPNARE